MFRRSKTLATHESGPATVPVNGREYGFRPTMHDDAGMRMTITIFDMGSPTEIVREVGTVDVRGGGPAVSSKTSPAFKSSGRWPGVSSGFAMPLRPIPGSCVRSAIGW